MAAGRPLTDEDRRQVAELHAQGFARNEIARRIRRSPSTVSKLADELGLDFDRAATKAATRAKVADAKARRAALSVLLIEDAHRLRKQLWQPCTLVKIGGKDNVATEHPLQQPLFEDKLKIMQACGIAVDKHARLVELDADQGAEDGKAMLTGLAEALGKAWAAGQNPPPADQ